MLQRQTLAFIAEQRRQATLITSDDLAYKHGLDPLYRDEEKTFSPDANGIGTHIFHPGKINTHPIQDQLDKTLQKLLTITTDYLEYIKLEAKKILINWPLEVLIKLDRHIEPVVALSFTLATVPILIDCSSLLNDSGSFLSTWLDNPCQEMVLKKLHNATCIYLCLTNETNKTAEKIWAVKKFLESSNIIQQMRMPRTPKVLPCNTRGAKFIKQINTGIIDSWVLMENLYSPTDIHTLQRSTVMRLEWVCLDYVNHLLDKTIGLLTTMSLTTLIKISEKSAEVAVQNRRLISVVRDDAKGSNKEFKIDCETVFKGTEYFPPAEHYHLKKSLTALKLLQLVEETNMEPHENQLNSFFDMLKQTYTQEYLLTHKSRFRGMFWKAEQSISGMFLTNLEQMQKYYSDHASTLAEAVSPQRPDAHFTARIRQVT